MNNKNYKLLALGDSYTIGEAVNINQRWPIQLAERLQKKSITLDSIIIATTGWTTDELQLGIEMRDLNDTYELVSLLIGVNNQYRSYPIEQYEREFRQLLEQGIKFAGNNPDAVMVISIPDYSVTPFTKEKKLNKKKIAREIDEYNAIGEKLTKLKNVKFIHITPSSREAKNDLSLIATDGLHPSGKMYSQWVDQMYDYVINTLL